MAAGSPTASDSASRPGHWRGRSSIPSAPTGRSVGSDERRRAGGMRYVVTYDIADDHRREDVATLLSGYGPRVQLSVFECDVRNRQEGADLQAKLRTLIDPVEDQVR